MKQERTGQPPNSRPAPPASRRRSCVVKRREVSNFNLAGLSHGLASVIILCLTLVCAGCHQESPEKKGDREVRAGRFESAIYWYEGALGNGDRAAIHLKMAEVFANRLRDSSSAAYHYRRILTLRAGGQASEKARAALRRLEANSSSSENGGGKFPGPARLFSPEEAAAAAVKEA